MEEHYLPDDIAEWKDEYRLPEPRDIARIHLAPGDVVILFYDGHIPPSEKERIAKQLKLIFPDNTTLVLDGGLRIAILGPEGV